MKPLTKIEMYLKNIFTQAIQAKLYKNIPAYI